MYEAAMKIENKILRAAFIARVAHDNQKRLYNGRPYVTHPGRVASQGAIYPGATEAFVCACWCHDCDEDTWVKIDQIRLMLGDEVADLVAEVTNPSKGVQASRKARKQMDLDHLRGASKWAKILKMLDRIDNLTEMEGAETSFKGLYAKESLALAEVVGDADPVLKEKLLETAKSLLHNA